MKVEISQKIEKQNNLNRRITTAAIEGRSSWHLLSSRELMSIGHVIIVFCKWIFLVSHPQTRPM